MSDPYGDSHGVCWDVSSELLSILRSPGAKAALRREGGVLVDTSGTRFPVVHGIPILLEDTAVRTEAITGLTEHDPRAEPNDASQGEAGDSQRAVLRAFRSRAESYYGDNYQPGRNPSREHRQRLVTSLIRDYFAPDGLILEAGSGPAVLGLDILDLTTRYVAVDLSPSNLIAGRTRIGAYDAVCGSVTALPFADDTFDAVAAVGCLEYIRPLSVAVAELLRVAKPDAPLILTFANKASPARWWDELIVLPPKRLRDRRQRRPVYRRDLTSVSEADGLIEATGGTVVATLHINQGVVGYPVSSLALSRRLWSLLTPRMPLLLRLASEFVIVARAPNVPDRH